MLPSLQTNIKDCTRFHATDLATALGEENAQALLLVNSARNAGLTPPEDEAPLVVGPELGVSFAVMHVLLRRANVAAEIGAAVLASRPEIRASLTQALYFHPDPLEEEADPFLFFSQIAPESIPVPAVDQYLDVVQDRYFIWRRPTTNIVELGRALLQHKPSSREGIQLDYLDALQRLRAKPRYETVWLGFTDGTRFIPKIEMQGLGAECQDTTHPFDPSVPSLEESFASKISVNITLAAREMKRRALGLQVVIP